MLAWKATLANSGASMGNAGFNAVQIFPEQPDEMELWPKGVVAPCGWWGIWLGVGALPKTLGRSVWLTDDCSGLNL